MEICESLWKRFTETGNPNMYILHKSINKGEEKGYARDNGNRSGDKTVGIR